MTAPPIVIRPRIQRPLLVTGSVIWGLLGATYFMDGKTVPDRNWFGIILGAVGIVMGVVGFWRAIRLGIVVNADGLRIRGFDSRDRVVRWHQVDSVDCEHIDDRAYLPIYAPVLYCGNEALPITALRSYSRTAAKRNAEKIRSRVPGV